MSSKSNGKSYPPAPFKVGSFRIIPERNAVVNGSGEETIEPRLMKVLLILAQEPGDVCRREDLVEKVWTDVFVTDHSLTNAISELRKVFDDDPQHPTYIETVRGAGYRLVAPIAPVSDDTPEESTEWTPESSRSSKTLRYVLAVAAGIALLVTGLIASVDRQQERPAITTVSALQGIETAPAYSPSGDRVAFSRFTSEAAPADLYVVDAKTRASHRLTDHLGAELFPTWAPDGQSIAFFAHGRSCGIYRIPASGGEWTLVRTTGCAVLHLTWSPDGTWIVYSDVDSSTGLRRIYRLDPESGSAEPVTEPPDGSVGDFQPRFGDDCCRIIFHRGRNAYEGDLFVLNNIERPTPPERLTDFDALMRGFDWSGDEASVVIAGLADGREGIWRIDGPGSAPRLAEPLSMAAMSVALASDGSVAFEGMTDELNLWRRTLGGDPARDDAPFIRSTRNDIHPDIAADGSQVAFISNRTGLNEVWVVASDGSDPRRRTFLEDHGTAHPRFSPDGRQIAFESRHDRQRDIFIVDVAGGTPRRLTTHGSDDLAPAWSADGKTIYFSSRRSGQWALWQVPVDGGPATLLLSEPVRRVMAHPDGNAVYYSRRDRLGIYVFALEEDRSRFVADGDSQHWDLTDRSLYVSRITNLLSPPRLYRHDLDSGETTELVTLTFNEAALFARWGIAVSPDGAWFVEVSLDRIESDLFAIE